MFGSLQFSQATNRGWRPSALDLFDEPAESVRAPQEYAGYPLAGHSEGLPLLQLIQDNLQGQGVLGRAPSSEQRELLAQMGQWISDPELSRSLPLAPSARISRCLELLHELGGQRDLLAAFASNCCRSGSAQAIEQREQVWKQFMEHVQVSGVACQERCLAVHEMIEALAEWATSGLADAPQRVKTAQWRIFCLLLLGPPEEEWQQSATLTRMVLKLLAGPLKRILHSYQSPAFTEARWGGAQDLRETLRAIRSGPLMAGFSAELQQQAEAVFAAAADEKLREPPTALAALVRACREGGVEPQHTVQSSPSSEAGPQAERPASDWDRALVRLILQRQHQGRGFRGPYRQVSRWEQLCAEGPLRFRELDHADSTENEDDAPSLSIVRREAPLEALEPTSATARELVPPALLEAQVCPIHRWPELEAWLKQVSDQLQALAKPETGRVHSARLAQLIHDCTASGSAYGHFLIQGLFFQSALANDRSAWENLEQDYRRLFGSALGDAVGSVVLRGQLVDHGEAIAFLQATKSLIEGICTLPPLERTILGFSRQEDGWVQLLRGIAAAESGSWCKAYLLQCGIENFMALQGDCNGIVCALEGMEGRGIGPEGPLLQSLLGQALVARAVTQPEVAELKSVVIDCLSQPGWSSGWKGLKKALGVP